MKAWQVYLLQCSDGSYYCGITNNMKRRIRQHNGELKGGAAYTRSRRPVFLLAALSMENRQQALSAEIAIKKMKPQAKRAFFQQCLISR